jgi:hypothetical protein
MMNLARNDCMIPPTSPRNHVRVAVKKVLRPQISSNIPITLTYRCIEFRAESITRS